MTAPTVTPAAIARRELVVLACEWASANYESASAVYAPYCTQQDRATLSAAEVKARGAFFDYLATVELTPIDGPHTPAGGSSQRVSRTAAVPGTPPVGAAAVPTIARKLRSVFSGCECPDCMIEAHHGH